MKITVNDAAKNDTPNKNKIIEMKDSKKTVIFLILKEILISRLKKYIDMNKYKKFLRNHNIKIYINELK